MSLAKIYERLNSGETLTDIYKGVSSNLGSYIDENDLYITIPQELITIESDYSFYL